ncbi:magnesium transporter [Halopseudomonas yangmingensis]|uniref:Magnesium transporter MgtE n=1 Tax=Halopseudomonas yangmingensis TaxID=1720063 RepID=A0A1I4QSF4_9GAMM|nr:magnesium transporter [Halopseudomonas yangmingensis]SFM42665.1 magnesium transporter [Halopseudomonas yangmingensis]
MTYNLVADALRAAMARQDGEAICRLLSELRPADLAEFLRQEQPREALQLFQQLHTAQRAEVFGYLPAEAQLQLAEVMDDHALSQLLTRMDADERADLFKLFDAERQERILRGLAHHEREDLRRLSSYAEGTAGSVMTSDYVVVPADMSARDALEHIRLTAPDAETIYQIYVLDAQQRIIGTLSLRELILGRPQAPISELMTRDVVSLQVHATQEEAARLISRYDLMTLPIIDEAQRMIGIITYDDALDVVEEEATEDIHKGATIGKLEGGLRGASLFTLYRKRIGWLVLLVFANIFSGAGIAYFEDTISAYIALVFFLPLLIDSGGNAGSQAATLMVRGLATGDVRFRDWGRLLGRELGVASALGLTMALAVSGLGFIRGGEQIALVVALSMVLVVMIGSLIGMCLPFLLQRLKLDPATASAPLVTSIADASGVLIYFGIATAILGLPDV